MNKADKKKAAEENATPQQSNPIPLLVKANVTYSHTLTQTERIEKSTAFFAKREEIELVESRMKATVSSFKDQLATLDAEAKELAGPARSGIEARTTLCAISFDVARKVRQCFEILANGDVGKLVVEIPMDRGDFEQVFQYEQEYQNQLAEEAAAKQAAEAGDENPDDEE